jgi:hypothetical protein
VNNADLTILPDTSLLGRTITFAGEDKRVYDSVATLFFAPGKGIIVNNTTNDQSFVKLRIAGNDSIRVHLRGMSTDPDYRWAGIQFNCYGLDSLILDHVTIDNAESGVESHNYVGSSGPAFLSISHCTFNECSDAIGNGRGVFFNGPAELSISSSIFDGCDNGIFLSRDVDAIVSYTRITDIDKIGIAGISSVDLTLNHVEVDNARYAAISLGGSDAYITGCNIHENENYGVYLYNYSTADLISTDIIENSNSRSARYRGAVYSENSDIRMKCCHVSDNLGKGIEMISGSLIMADLTGSTTHHWGGNEIKDNTREQLDLPEDKMILQVLR